MSTEERFDEIYVGGVHLSDVIKGDVPDVQQQLMNAIANGEEWVNISVGPDVRYVVRITPSTDIVVRYRDI
ncbi:hypothetical protein PlfCFBP13513_14775 [Plantibacter flavus]|uniref:hypothetical protein n=1 Tax=Plantibacter TaxID=190323 RepID=UPI0010C16128|nr:MULTISPECIES: hypothetical protein [Plantibacter]MBD8103761.1 hypothetical protein [Plantibacter sp. CFBP 8775]MBD8467210.1 hypothetical protein [Plantibacter sp. CFBP 8798]MBD8516387.1 hypothetical protein [Plantibacter sp. CFBP 8804]TKJ96693.1 hypothetical protein PlfCFBP13513_14775 [Plantibacter flavus]